MPSVNWYSGLMSDPITGHGLPEPAPSETVVITTKNDTTLRGVLVARTPDGFVLRAASVMQTRGGEDRWQALIGDTVVPLEQVDYWQRSLPIEVLEALKNG